MNFSIRLICGLVACLSPSLAIAETVTLSSEDVHDIRCAWAFQIATRSLAQDDASKPLMMNGEYWFAGRIDGRHPSFGVNSEIIRRQFSRETPPNDDELEACAAIFLGVMEKDLKGE